MPGNVRTNEDGKINSILLIDNEHENIADLEMILKNATRKFLADEANVVYTASPDEAAREMIKAYTEGYGFSAIISDDHMDQDLQTGTATIDGQDFLRIVGGHAGYCISHAIEDLEVGNFSQFSNFNRMADRLIGKSSKLRYGHQREIIEFMERNFRVPEMYQRFVDYYAGRSEAPMLMLYCGHPTFVDSAGLDDVALVQKKDGCEQRALDYLKDEGIIPIDSIAPFIEEHPRLCSKGRKKYNPMSTTIRRFLGKGKKFAR